jgi:DNA-binding beta-propeller fold protein YncE
MATLDETGRIYVADRGTGRIQVFDATDHRTPRRIIKLPSGAGPMAVAVRGTQMAAVTDRNTLLLWDLSAADERPTASLGIEPGARCVAFGPGQSLLVGFNAPPDHFGLRRYQRRADKLAEAGVVAPSYTTRWPNLFPAATPLSTGPQAQVWFTDLNGKLLSLDPRSDKVRERGEVPWRTVAVGFGRDGTLYTVGSFDKDGKSRINPFRVSGQELKPLDPIPARSTLAPDANATIWGLLPDDDGGVYVRVVEEGWQKGWPALTIKKLYADGTVKPWLDFGELYAKRRAFGPWECVYSLQFDAQRNIVFTALPLQAVYKVTREGKILWEASQQPQGGADKVALLAPRGVAVDSRGRTWVVDSETQKIYCLSPAGKLLLEHGGAATWDDVRGAGFSRPSGIAVVALDGVDYLYVGDAGNQRIVKYRVETH